MPVYSHPVVRKVTQYAMRHLEKWMVDLHEIHAPTAAQQSALDLTLRTRAHLLALLEYEPGRAEVWRGYEKESGQFLKVAYVGNEKAYRAQSPSYLKKILFQGDVQSEDICAIPAGSSRPVSEDLANDSDLVIVEANDALQWQPTAGEWRFFPTSVHMVMKYFGYQTWDEIENAMYLQKRKIKTFQRNGLSLEISRSAEDFDLFYDRMYVPMMENRHAGYGIVHSKENFWHQFQAGLLMLVRDQGGQAIGGGLFLLRKKTATLLHTGLLDGDTYWYDFGASSAMYYHSIRWFYDQQFHYYNAGGSRPFKSDGLYEFKRRWGMKPVRDLWNPRHWMFWVPHGSEPALRWLRSHENVFAEKAA